MNYSHAEIKRKQKEITSSARKMKYRVEEWLVYCGTILIITLLLMFVIGMAGAVRGMIDSAPTIEELDVLSKGYTTKIYDSSGSVVQKLSHEDSMQEYAVIEEIPEHVQEAFIAAEDSRFMEHHGVDMQGLFYSIYYSVTGKSAELEQAKTITQQLVQNQILNGATSTSFWEKISKAVKEQYMAISLEDNLDKAKILEYYLNTVSMGQSMIGVQAASKWYFNKDISEVNISEAAVLASIVSNPSKYNPVKAQEENGKRRNIVLKNMLEEKFISEDEYEEALGDDVYYRIQNVNHYMSHEQEKTNSYYADAVEEQVISDLKEKLGYSETEAYNALYRGGLRIYTCQDPSLQKVCDDVINSDKYYPDTVSSYLSYRLVIEKDGRKQEYSELNIKDFFLDENDENISLYFADQKTARKYAGKFRREMLKSGGRVVSESIRLIKQPQASFVLMEQSTGKVVAIVGGRGEQDGGYTENRATECKRQPGSALTMLSTYTPALDTAGITLGSIQDDTPYSYQGITEQLQKSNEQYGGLMTLREAIVAEKSVPALKTLQEVSVQTGYEFLKKFAFTTLVDQKESEDGKVYSDLQLQLALGELNDGVTNLELTAAYAALANGGIYTRPRFYTKIVNRDGNILLENEEESNRIVKEETAWLLTDVMQDVIQQGRAGAAGFTDTDVAVAGYNGSTGNNTDFWFEGYTPFYTAGIWSGIDESIGQTDSDYHMVIWKEIMERIHKETQRVKGDFHKPKSIVSRMICNKCGNLAVKGICDKAEGGSAERKEYFDAGTAPVNKCNCHVKYAFCKASDELASDNCPKEDIYYRVLLQKIETMTTEDSKNTVSQNIGKNICNVHSQK